LNDSVSSNLDTVRRIALKNQSELHSMRSAGHVVALALDAVFDALEPGITTAELDDIARRTIAAEGAKPAFLGLYGFPAVACISLNAEIVHGIPGERVVSDGDLVSVDCGAIVDGLYSDCARTAVAGGCANEDRLRLVDACRESLERGIAECVPGNRVGDISEAVEQYVRDAGFDLVREYVGHGVGRKLHEAPPVPNFGSRGTGPLLMNGMTIAIEPMIMTGSWETKVLDDGWTVVTADGSLSAHFEHTVAITADRPEVLTSAIG
jgi:methionyl aminopeptidase